MSNVTLNVNDLPANKQPKKSDSQGNSFKITKMVIADPGLGMEAEIRSSLSGLTCCGVEFSLGRSETDLRHRVTTILYVSEGTLTIPSSFVFAVPFVDLKYITDIGEDLYYKIEVYYNVNFITTPSVVLSTSGKMPAGTVKGEGSKLECAYDGNTNFHGVNQQEPQSGPNALSYEQVLFHEVGSSFKLTFPSIEEQIGICDIFLKPNNGAQTNCRIKIEALEGHFKLDSQAYAWVPYPKPAPINHTTSIIVNGYKKDSIHELVSLENTVFAPQPNGFSIADKSIKISVKE